MNTNSHTPSAKIYRFPVKATVIRSGAASSTGKGQTIRLTVAPNVEFGSGWYHDSAILTERGQKP